MLNSYYYVSDMFSNKIFIFNESWSYVTSEYFYRPAYFTTIGNSLYATGEQNIWKLDSNLNILIQYNAIGTSPLYRGIYFNSTNDFIYVAAYYFYAINVFNLNIDLSYKISTLAYSPFSITAFNNQLYVGTDTGTILVIENKVIKDTFTGCNGNSVLLTYILFDSCGLMATSCYTNQSSLYDLNGRYLKTIYPTLAYPTYIGYDSKGHFIRISKSEMNIYN